MSSRKQTCRKLESVQFLPSVRSLSSSTSPSILSPTLPRLLSFAVSRPRFPCSAARSLAPNYKFYRFLFRCSTENSFFRLFLIDVLGSWKNSSWYANSEFEKLKSQLKSDEMICGYVIIKKKLKDLKEHIYQLKPRKVLPPLFKQGQPCSSGSGFIAHRRTHSISRRSRWRRGSQMGWCRRRRGGYGLWLSRLHRFTKDRGSSPATIAAASSTRTARRNTEK